MHGFVHPPWWLLVAATVAHPPSSIDPGRASPPGELRIVELESEIFGNTRSLRVWLPPGYGEPENADHRYPALYLNDGQNLFDAGTSQGSSEWRVDEVVAELLREGRVRPVVVVGIDNAGRRGRAREYLPWPDAYLSPPEPDPWGRLYDDFLADEVLPFVEAHFRVARGPEERVLGGSSYGALAATYAAIARPDLFSGLLLESPSFYVDDDHVLRLAEDADFGLDRVYLGVGTNELALPGCPDHPDNALAVEGVRRMAGILARAGLEKGEDVRVVVEECAVHDEAAWARRLPHALEFLFPSLDRSPGAR